MRNRRDFLKQVAGATAGVAVAGGGLAGAFQAPAARRRAMIAGRRITVIDIHAHHFIPEVADLVRGTKLEAEFKGQAGNKQRYLGPGWFQYMDKEGIDISVLNMNPWWYAADRDLARRICDFQNEKTAEWVKRYPDRFVGMATCALQFPDLAAEQLEFGVRKLGFRGAPIGGSVEGVELSDRRFDPFWAKAQELGVVLFMHPQQAPGTTDNARLEGKGALGNTIGNPLETTVFLSHLIFEGTLDRFPGLKICAAHAGGYLPSYLGRSDVRCGRGKADCTKLTPSEYFRNQLYIDSMIFHEEGLRHLVAEVGVDHIVYGTDFPFDWPVGIDFILNASFLTNAQKEQILGGNLIKLLGVKPVAS
ncbi:MAG: amidohydrolase [Acidobacteria bacterium]|nr:amidohydrolase [Acidobacteriota bacterium]